MGIMWRVAAAGWRGGGPNQHQKHVAKPSTQTSSKHVGSTAAWHRQRGAVGPHLHVRHLVPPGVNRSGCITRVLKAKTSKCYCSPPSSLVPMIHSHWLPKSHIKSNGECQYCRRCATQARFSSNFVFLSASLSSDLRVRACFPHRVSM